MGVAMTAPQRAQIGDHYLDSGPLFCLGGSQVLADLFDAHFLPRSKVVGAVVAPRSVPSRACFRHRESMNG